MYVSRLLATDLDGTLIGDHDSMQRLWAELKEIGVTVAFSTGRHLDSVEEFYTKAGLEGRAQVCICMVGTEVWWLDAGRYRPDRAWIETIRHGWDVSAAIRALDGVAELVRQPDEWQSEFKVSYFLDRPPVAGVGDIEQALHDAGLAARIVYSAGRYLDVLPERSGKGSAVAYVADRLGVAPQHVVVAGDSGNDLDMMRPELGFRAVAVGNASPELSAHRAPRLYHATEHHAAGIREGLVHHGWLDP